MNIERGEIQKERRSVIGIVPLRIEEKSGLDFVFVCSEVIAVFVAVIGKNPELAGQIAVFTATIWGIESFIDRLNKK